MIINPANVGGINLSVLKLSDYIVSNLIVSQAADENGFVTQRRNRNRCGGSRSAGGCRIVVGEILTTFPGQFRNPEQIVKAGETDTDDFSHWFTHEG